MKNIVRAAALGLAVLVASAGVAAAQDRDHDRDDNRYQQRYDHRYDRGYDRGYDWGYVMRIAHDNGYRDGVQVAREDMWRGKPFNPYPRGRYQWADHGYNRGFGDRGAYRERYADGYRDGYLSVSRGPRGYRGSGYDR